MPSILNNSEGNLAACPGKRLENGRRSLETPTDEQGQTDFHRRQTPLDAAQTGASAFRLDPCNDLRKGTAVCRLRRREDDRASGRRRRRLGKARSSPGNRL